MRYFRFIACVLILAGVNRARAVTVSPDESGDFKTVQEAITAAPENGAQPFVIHIKPGTYDGPLIVPKNKPNIVMQGDDATTTILRWDRNVRDPIPPGGDGFNPGMLVLAKDFVAANLTIENTSGDHGQALALRVDGDRDVFVNCKIAGWQDTLMVNNGRDFFKDCYIAGRVDFIYGSATAWFQDCEIHSRNGGHVTAASTPQDNPYGYVFMTCKLTGDAKPWDPATTNPSTTLKPKVTPQADLGRPWRPYASVTYLNCDMGSHIKPAGWNNWGKTSNEATARYSEYQGTGPGGDASHRAPWSHQLTDDQAKQITIPTVLSGDDHWDPASIAQPFITHPTTAQ
jgi:pectinesterase